MMRSEGVYVVTGVKTLEEHEGCTEVVGWG